MCIELFNMFSNNFKKLIHILYIDKLFFKIIMSLSRFELLTLRLSGVYSNQLSYRPFKKREFIIYLIIILIKNMNKFYIIFLE